jgi:hypothetical protein
VTITQGPDAQAAYFRTTFSCQDVADYCQSTIEYLASCNVTGTTEATCLQTTRTEMTWSHNAKRHGGTVYPLHSSNTTLKGSSLAVATASITSNSALLTTRPTSSCSAQTLDAPESGGLSQSTKIALGITIGIAGFLLLILCYFWCCDPCIRYRRL